MYTVSSSSGNPSLHGSMSSSADFSDEDDYSGKSGSASPAPGDTLPWNLPRHERSKRKIHVLDPAERAVLRIAVLDRTSGSLRLFCSVTRPAGLPINLVNPGEEMSPIGRTADKGGT
ncbi:microtubule-actin cross-linking factor 1-like [Antennarius striatus]|uniref:microtubule-actin cross-linking factor 1-like n=1 Tax=Antennarius striatus TaxID=241820 RepID=UPI0035B4CD2B